ncbi:E3 ubiquitin/ISG15 ligase TRIM25-like [Hyperolius riggenbachi]|uniref:E3 ubiquitin/ISG15 ligase TRIM25-like n=1 Tax=Hyperolius riggenbachi TaxID=752182 RepID=UPI0035A33AFE
MASADVTAELRCSICMEIYRDPVTLPCGHNFCRDCITQAWDHQKHLREYKCPDCQKIYRKRPELVRNTTLHNICEAFHATETDQEQTGVFCNYCDFPVPATKSCLQCETSLCDHHLRKHDRSGGHTLLPPTTDLGKRKCPTHKKILEYYCTEDAACICVSCRLKGEHVGHNSMSLDEASEEKKKKLRNDLQKLMAETEEAVKRVQSLEERRRKAQEKADAETERVTALFRDLCKRLEDLEKKVLSDIMRQTERVSQSYNDIIQQLEIKKEELSRKMRHIEELCNMTDPLTVLQESDTGDLCDTEDRERHDKQLHDGGDLDVAGISHTLHTGLSEIMSGVIVQKHTDTQAYPHSSTEDKVPITAKLSKPRLLPKPPIQLTQCPVWGANIGVVQQTSGVIVQKHTDTQAYPHSSAEDKVPITAKLSKPRLLPKPPIQLTQCPVWGANIRVVQQTSGVIVQKHTDTQAFPHSSAEDNIPITAKLSRPHPQPTSTTQHTQAHPNSSTEDKASITAELSRPRPHPTAAAQHTQAYPHSSTEDEVPITGKLSRPRPQPTPTAQHTQAHPHYSTEDEASITTELSRPHPQPTATATAQHTQATTEDKVSIIIKVSGPRPLSTPTTSFPQHTQRQAGETNIGAAQQTSGLPVYADILLDVTTAGNYLQVSSDRKTASRTDRIQNHPETPERFQHPQVLSSQSFSSGRHYWDVDVGGSRNWRVGMCYPSIDRKGCESGIGWNSKSWCLYRRGNQYSVTHDWEEIELPDKIPSDKVRIYLDYEAGQISFYALCDPIRHLQTFTATFTEPLHAALWVVDGCIRISGGNQGV